jgi:hypothetical protein
MHTIHTNNCSEGLWFAEFEKNTVILEDTTLSSYDTMFANEVTG